MPVTVNQVFQQIGLVPKGPLPWGEKVPNSANGVYVISTSQNPAKNLGLSPAFKIDKKVLQNWKGMSPKLNVQNLSTPLAFEAELNQFWKPKENILYIGESTSITNGLAKRVNQFYMHKPGWKGPHTGGYWIKLLANLKDLYVYYGECEHPRDTEFKMLMYFIEKSTGKSFYDIKHLGMHLPFANLKVDFQKKHQIEHAVNKTKKP
jgi:hypothetical protein